MARADDDGDHFGLPAPDVDFDDRPSPDPGSRKTGQVRPPPSITVHRPSHHTSSPNQASRTSPKDEKRFNLAEEEEPPKSPKSPNAGFRKTESHGKQFGKSESQGSQRKRETKKGKSEISSDGIRTKKSVFGKSLTAESAKQAREAAMRHEESKTTTIFDDEEEDQYKPDENVNPDAEIDPYHQRPEADGYGHGRLSGGGHGHGAALEKTSSSFEKSGSETGDGQFFKKIKSGRFNPFINRGTNIQVAVRVRPFNDREQNDTLCVFMPSPIKVEVEESEGHHITAFEFTRAYYSHEADSTDKTSKSHASQATLMEEIGQDLKKSVFEGLNSCVFAYGQTGSGKTFTIMGNEKPKSQRGLTSRVMKDIFDSVEQDSQSDGPSNFQCRVSYMEVHHESINDLLVCPTDDPERKSKVLHVTQNPKLGVIIPNLTESAVASGKDVQKILDFGSKTRSVAATCMNSRSSRSHCIFTLEMQRDWKNQDGQKVMLRAKLQFVDLAGSEKQKRNAMAGEECAYINQSVSNLTQLIHKIATTEKHRDNTTYKNCKLTLILSEALQGNYRTTMIATIAPGLSNLSETLATLRVASETQKIHTNAVKNEISVNEFSKEMQQEADRLKEAFRANKKLPAHGTKSGNISNRTYGISSSMDELNLEAQEQLEAAEWLANKYSKDFGCLLQESKEAQEKRSAALEDMGLSTMEIAESMQVHKDSPQLINLSDDPALNGCLIYFLDNGQVTMLGSSKKCKIRLQGLGVKPIMCSIFNEGNRRLLLKPGDSCRVLVNGSAVIIDRQLKHHDRLILGHAHCYRVVIPLEAAATSEEMKEVAKQLDTALGEVVAQESADYQQCRIYIGEMKTRLGEKRAQKFLEDFGRHVPMVQEANEYANEMRSKEQYKIQLEVMSDIYTYQTDEPEFVFRFMQRIVPLPDPKTRMKNAIKKSLMDRKKAAGKQVEDEQPVQEKTIALWDTQEFTNRLNHMRDIYECWSSNGPNSVDFSNPENNPWYVGGPLDVAQVLRKQNAERDTLEEQHIEEVMSKMEEHGNQGDATGSSMPGGKNLNKVLEQVKTQKARIEELEKEVETLKNLQLGVIQQKIGNTDMHPTGRIDPAEREQLQSGIAELADRLKVLKCWGHGLASAGTHNWAARIAEDQRSLAAFQNRVGAANHASSNSRVRGIGSYPGGGAGTVISGGYRNQAHR
eukprot:gnl/MRDRNA2_/MRDRNA2_96189_c0_seq1.p1 gnl/MRDRNA2_/MRDRNA2_96189_c0~~gnl/MRDRNA2_/MRDRNA2_96189_c0_seq1.p1  ORF type:complete len:1191 (+),score=233.88 gnl/MRDRNA2_/MRDRNA2_96189_c0_seq1:70-3642(+)